MSRQGFSIFPKRGSFGGSHCRPGIIYAEAPFRRQVCANFRVWFETFVARSRGNLSKRMIVEESELNGTMESLIFPHVSTISQVHSESRSFQSPDLGVKYRNTLATHRRPLIQIHPCSCCSYQVQVNGRNSIVSYVTPFRLSFLLCKRSSISGRTLPLPSP